MAKIHVILDAALWVFTHCMKKKYLTLHITGLWNDKIWMNERDEHFTRECLEKQDSSPNKEQFK